MENSKREFLPFKHGIHISKGQLHKNPKEKELMSEKPYASNVEKELMSEKPYASVVGSLMYAMLCAR